MKFKKILCPTDFSAAAYEALKVAAGMARDYSSELLIVNVVESLNTIPPADTIPAGYLQQALREMELAAQKQLKDLVNKNIFAKIKVTPLIATGRPADQIVELADKKKVDVIVIATHGQTGWRRFVFGSVAERVIKQTLKPVLVIHTHQEE